MSKIKIKTDIGVTYEYDSIIDEAVKRASKELADEMDFSILADLFKQSGWVEIEFNPHVESILAYEIQHWMRDNCKGYYKSRGKRFLFELEKDAAWFALRWVNGYDKI